MLTLFAAIKPPPHIIRAACAAQKGIEGIHWAAPENLHITLGYFGLIADDMAEVLDHELGRVSGTGFELRLAGADVFGGSRPHTLWMGIEKSAALTSLNKQVRAAGRRSKIDMETRRFTPHLSLAYLRGGVALSDLALYMRRHIAYRSKPFLVDQFALYSSNQQKSGPNIYKKEANYPLLG